MNYCNCPNCRTDNCPNAESPVEKAYPASAASKISELSTRIAQATKLQQLTEDNQFRALQEADALRSALAAQREEIVQNQGEWATLMASVQEDFANEKADRGRGRVTLVLTLLGQLRSERDSQREEIEKLRAALEQIEDAVGRVSDFKINQMALAALTKPQPSQA